MTERRLKLLLIERQLLLTALDGILKGTLDFSWENKLPKHFNVVNVAFDHRSNCWAVVVQHESFEIVPDGCELPILDYKVILKNQGGALLPDTPGIQEDIERLKRGEIVGLCPNCSARIYVNGDCSTCEHKAKDCICCYCHNGCSAVEYTASMSHEERDVNIHNVVRCAGCHKNILNTLAKSGDLCLQCLAKQEGINPDDPIVRFFK